MIIKYPDHHKWYKHFTDDTTASFGKNTRSRLRVLLRAINAGETSISCEVLPLDDDILNWFIPLYTKTISKKNNAKLFDIRATTIGKNGQPPYFALVLKESGVLIGATIFSKRETLLSIAYRVHPNNWFSHSFQASPSLYTEFALTEYAMQQGYKKISHGRDRNPYGINSDIGLCVFKLSVGCTPSLPETDSYEEKTLNTDDLTVDTLVLHLPVDGKEINQASLFLFGDITEKYKQVVRYPELLKICTYKREDNNWVVQ